MLARIRRTDGGFSLVELLTVVIVIGILAAIALPTFLRQKEKGYRATLESDLRSAAAAQEIWATSHAGAYTGNTADLTREGFEASSGVVVEVENAGVDGFCLSAYHDGMGGPDGLRIYYSTAAGAPTEDACA